MSSEWFIMRVDPHEGYLEWPQHEVPISPEQAALGALQDHEVAIVVLNRAGIRDNWRSDDGLIVFAKNMGLWPEVGKDGG